MPELKNSQDAGPQPPAATPLASWYAQGLSDGLGDRLLMFDNSDAPSLELLRFRRELAESPAFEAALRERVQQLSHFQHPAFARVRAVQRLEPDDDLALISNSTPGKRLSEVLHRASGPELAATLIRQLAPALVLLQQHEPGGTHGVLGADRIVVSPDGRLTIVEHVVGPAIDTLGLPTDRLVSLGIGLPPALTGEAPRLDVATDWYQLGLAAVSVLIGRPVAAKDLPQLDTLLDRHGLSPFMREWLDRALQISGSRIESGVHARQALDEFLRKERPGDSLRLVSKPFGPVAPAPVAAEPIAPEAVAQVAEAQVEEAQVPVAPEPQPPLDSVDFFPPERPAVESPASRSSIFGLRSSTEPRPSAPPAADRTETVRIAPPRRTVSTPAPASKPPVAVRKPPAQRASASRPVQAPAAAAPSRSRTVVRARISTAVVATLVAIALGEAVIIAALTRALWLAQNPAITVTAAGPPGELLVSSRSAEAAPLRLTVAPDLSWVRVSAASSEGVVGEKASTSATGTMQVTSPIPLKVFEQSRLLGTTPGADIRLKAGPHDIELVNLAAGYRVRQAIQIEAGQTLSVHIAPPHGWITAYATPDADVLIDGERVGRTPLGPLPMALGEHQVSFYHPSGAGDRQRVTVTSGATVRVIGNPRR